MTQKTLLKKVNALKTLEERKKAIEKYAQFSRGGRNFNQESRRRGKVAEG